MRDYTPRFATWIWQASNVRLSKTRGRMIVFEGVLPCEVEPLALFSDSDDARGVSARGSMPSPAVGCALSRYPNSDHI
jgi:hypothetical protein